MPRLDFKGRGWDTESRIAELTKSNMIVVVPEHCNIHANGNVKKLVCGCNPDLAGERGYKGNCLCCRRREKLRSLQASLCKSRCGRVEAEAEAPPSTAAQTRGKPVRVDGEIGSNSGGTFGDICLPTDWEVESESNVLSGTSDSDADGWLIYEDGYSDTSADSSPGGGSATLEDLYDDGL